METDTSSRNKAEGPSDASAKSGTKGGSLEKSPGNALLEAESVDYFVSFVQVFGLPKSIGQIYGLLFVAFDPLPMDEIVLRLGISKGSASQGLSLLKGLGAVESAYFPPDRREHFRADLNVSRIVSHFFEKRLQPRLESGDQRLEKMLDLIDEGSDNAERESEATLSVVNRIRALQKWQKRGHSVLPLISHWLKR